MVRVDILESKIKESGLKKGFIIEKLGIAPSTFRRKMKGEVDFTSSEIRILTEILNLEKDEVIIIFAF